MAKLSDKIIVKVDEEDREIFMSFGLLNELTKIIKDPTRVSSVAVDFELREEVLTSLLAVRKKSGKISEKVNLDDADISVEDVERLIEWSSEHVLSFFVRSLKKVVGLTKKHQGEMSDLVSSVNGFMGSISETVSAGPTDAVPVNSNDEPTG